MRYLRVDEDFIETLNIKMMEGRSFAEKSPGTSALIIKEAAVRALDLKEPIGTVASNSLVGRGEVIGVIK